MQPAKLLVLQLLTGTTFDDFDLKDVPPPGCGDPGAIVVCGRRRSNRLEPLPQEEFEQKPLKPETKIFGGGTAKAHVERKEFPGAVSNRAMLTVKIPF